MALKQAEKSYITEKYARWKFGRIRYWESVPAGENMGRDKPALLMLHGYGAMIEHWRATFADLQGRYRMYALDLLGLGNSDKPNGYRVNYSARLWAEQVRDFLRHKGENKVFLAGHSMGGMVSLQFALTYPEMVAGLILVDSAGLPDQAAAEQEAAQKSAAYRRTAALGNLTYNLIKTPGVGEALAFLLASPNPWAVRRFLENSYWHKEKVTPELVEQFLTPLRSPGASGSYLGITRSFTQFQLPLKPGALKGPVLILWGEHDRQMPPGNMLPRWKKLLPQAATFVVADAAHCPQDERPDLVNPQIARFIDEVVAGTWKSPAANTELTA